MAGRAGGKRSGGSGEALGARALNRALLARQGVLERWTGTAEAALQGLVGLQAQSPNPPYVGLWTRLEDFRAEDLSQLVVTRRAVRIALMRSTIHLVTAADCLRLRPLLAPMLDRAIRAPYGKRLAGLDERDVAEAARKLVEEKPLTLGGLGAALAERWPDRDPAALSQAARAWVPLVQVPPRGVWGAGGLAVHTTAEQWLGRPMDETSSPDELVLRYLGAFGPASVRDAQTWAGLKALKEVFERLRPRLLTFRDERGAELFDLPDAPRPDADFPAPPRFLPEYDNVLLSHAERSRIIAPQHRPRLMTVNGIIPGTLLVDGFVRGQWKASREGRTAVLAVELFEPVPPADRALAAEEGERLLAFVASDAESRDVRVIAAR
jgi:hypothetical protein